MTLKERNDFWEDAYQGYRFAGYTVDVSMEYADQDTQDWMDSFA